MSAPRIDRMVVVYERKGARRYERPKPGATKVIRGQLHVRVRETTGPGWMEGMSVLRNGRPGYDWMPVAAPELGIRRLRLA